MNGTASAAHKSGYGYIKGVLLILCAGVLWGTSSPIAKHLSQSGVDIFTIVFFRALLASSGCALLFFVKSPDSFRVTPRDLLFLSFFGAVGVAAVYVGFFMSLSYLSVPLAVVLFYSYPLMTAIFSSLATAEKPGKRQIIAAILTLAAVSMPLVFHRDLSTAIDLRGVWWCLLSAAGMATYSLLGRRAVKGGSLKQSTLFFYGLLFATLWMIILKSATTGWHDIMLLSASQWGWILYLGYVMSLMGYGLFFMALNYVPASTASVIGAVEIVVAMALSSYAISQPPEIAETMGAVLIILSIVMVSKEKIANL